MRQFNRFLAEKLKDKDFEKSYNENCNICPTVLNLVEKAIESGKSWEEIAEETGLDASELIRFSEADNCNKDIIVILCCHYGIAYPDKCPRFKFEDK